MPPRGTHHCEAYATFAAPFGIAREAYDWRPELFLSAREERAAERRWRALGDGRRLFVNLSASVPERRWPDEHCIEVLRQVSQSHPDLRVIVSGVPQEAASVERVARAVGALALPRIPLRQAFALVATADAVFTPDTSIAHAAAAFGKPTVALYPRQHAAFVPYRVPGRALFSRGAAIRSITPAEVTRALTETVAGISGDAAATRGA
jgi:ADP-heptose:LPS heptosyltransferase